MIDDDPLRQLNLLAVTCLKSGGCWTNRASDMIRSV